MGALKCVSLIQPLSLPVFKVLLKSFSSSVFIFSIRFHSSFALRADCLHQRVVHQFPASKQMHRGFLYRLSSLCNVLCWLVFLISPL